MLTIYNCEELADVCLSQDKLAQKRFVEKYKGRIIEVNLKIIYAENSGASTSQFAPANYLLAPIDMNNKEGASRFYLEEMMMFDFKWDKATRPSYLTIGSQIRVRGTVLSESNDSLIYLKPIISWGTVSFQNSTVSEKSTNTLKDEPAEIDTYSSETFAEITSELFTAETTVKTDEETEYQIWVLSQFNLSDGSHKTLSEMIRAYVIFSGGTSYRHIETYYQPMTDNDTLNSFKTALRQSGFDPKQLSINDVVVTSTVSFSDQNGVKRTQSAAAIARYSSDTLLWLNVDIEWALAH